MKRVLCLVLFVITGKTLTVNPRSVNVALETVLKFDNRGKSTDLQLIDNVQTFLSKVRNAISGRIIDRRYFNGSNPKMKFSDFIENLITTLRNYSDEDLEDVLAVVSDEIRKYHHENWKFYELLDVDHIRSVGRKLDQIKYVPAETIRKKLKEALTLLRTGKLDVNVQEFIDYIDSLYTLDTAFKLNKFRDDLELYSFKSERANLNLIKIVREGIRNIIFDQYKSLNVKARRDIKIRLETFWKNYMDATNVKHNVFDLKSDKKNLDKKIKINDPSRSVDGMLSVNNNLGGNNYKKSPKHYENVILEDKVKTHNPKTNSDKNDSEDKFNQLEKNKRKRIKTKNYHKINYFTTKKIYNIKNTSNKRKHTKNFSENKIHKINEDDNIDYNSTETELITNKNYETKEIIKPDVFNKTKKPIFLSLHPEDFTAIINRKRSKNRVTIKRHKKHSIHKVITTKTFDLDRDKLEEKKTRHENFNHLNITEAPESMEIFNDELKMSKISKRKKPKQYHKNRQMRKTKKHKSYSKFRKSRGSLEEGIPIESFEKDQRYLIYRKSNDDDEELNSNTLNKKPIKDVETQLKTKNVNKITTELNPKLNEINSYGDLEFWERTPKSTKKSTTLEKTTTSATKPTTSATTQKIVFVTNSTKIKNLTGIFYRTNDKDMKNVTVKKDIINKIYSLALPFKDAPNDTTLKNKHTTKAKQNDKKAITQLIQKAMKTQTNTTESTLTYNTIKTSPKFNLGNFLNQSNIDLLDDKKKLLHDKIVKDMEVIFKTTTPTVATLPKDATDPFKDIEEALDFI